MKRKKLKQSTSKQTTSLTNRRQTRYLGIKMFSLTPQIVEEMRYHMPTMLAVNRGVYIAGVMANSTAQRAGLQLGDIIIEVNGHKIETSADLIKHVQEDEKLNLKLFETMDLHLIF